MAILRERIRNIRSGILKDQATVERLVINNTVLPDNNVDQGEIIVINTPGYEALYTLNLAGDHLLQFAPLSLEEKASIMEVVSGGGATVDLTNYLAKDNATEFTPTGDYNPATKKYADDLINGLMAGYALATGTTEEELTITTADTVSSALGKLQKQALDNEEVAADALIKLNQSIGNNEQGEFKPTNEMISACTTVLEAVDVLAANSGDKTNVLILDYATDLANGVSGQTVTPEVSASLLDAIETGKVCVIKTDTSDILANLQKTGDNVSVIMEQVSNITGTLLATNTTITVDTTGNTISNIASAVAELVDKSNILTKDNTEEFIPDADYEPTTKKYVDDAITKGLGTIDLTPYLSKTNETEYTPTGDYNPATKKYVDDGLANQATSIISQITASAPETLDTLNELAAALGNDPNFATTVTEQLGNKLDTSAYTADKETFALKTDLTNYLAKDNAEVFTPTTDYNPATKKYADDTIATAIAGQLSGYTVATGSTEEELTIQTGDTVAVALGKLQKQSLDNETVVAANLSKLNDSIGNNENGEFKPTNELISASTTVLSAVDTLAENLDNIDLTQYLSKTNTTEYTPTEDYNPSTKKYVDDAVTAGVGTIDLTPYLAKTNEEEFTPTGDYNPSTKKYTDDTIATAIAGQLSGYTVATGTSEEELTIQTTDTVSVALGKLQKQTLDNEEVTADALVKLNQSVGNNEQGEFKPTNELISASTTVLNAIDTLANSITGIDWSQYLSKTNETEFTPTGDYNPATKKYVDDGLANQATSIISQITASAPETLDTLNELAAALGNDPNFATTVTEQLGNKVDTTAYTADKATFALKTDLTNYIAKDNAEEFTPTTDYNPATKKYVDDAVTAGVGTIDLTPYLSKTNTTEYTPTEDYNPATKKYADDAIAGQLSGYTVATGMTEEELTIQTGDTVAVALGKLQKQSLDNEEVVAANLSKLNDSMGNDENGNFKPTNELISASTTVLSAVDTLAASISGIDLTPYLSKTNEEEYTPTGDYNPSTKKYVDDTVNGQLSGYTVATGTSEEELSITTGDTVAVALGKLQKQSLDNEKVVAATIVRLNDSAGNEQDGTFKPINALVSGCTSAREAIDLLASLIEGLTGNTGTTATTLNRSYQPITATVSAIGTQVSGSTPNFSDSTMIGMSISGIAASAISFTVPVYEDRGNASAVTFHDERTLATTNGDLVNVITNGTSADGGATGTYTIDTKYVTRVLTQSEYTALGSVVNTDNVTYFVKP